MKGTHPGPSGHPSEEGSFFIPSWEGWRVSGGVGSFINAGGGETETLKGRGFGGRNDMETTRSALLAGPNGSAIEGGEK